MLLIFFIFFRTRISKKALIFGSQSETFVVLFITKIKNLIDSTRKFTQCVIVMGNIVITQKI